MKIFLRERTVKAKSLLKYRDIEKFEALCKGCPSYMKNWACPPVPPSVGEAFKKDKANIVAVRLVFDECDFEAYKNDKSFLKSCVLRVRRAADPVLKDSESGEGRAFLPGTCTICESCARIESKDCIHPESMRYNIDALGMDLGAVLKEEMGIELNWAGKELPPCICLICAVFAEKAICPASEICRALLDAGESAEIEYFVKG